MSSFNITSCQSFGWVGSFSLVNRHSLLELHLSQLASKHKGAICRLGEQTTTSVLNPASGLLYCSPLDIIDVNSVRQDFNTAVELMFVTNF
jgi:hypothetical protein